MPNYVHNFNVKGMGSFPIDMLRYDSCYPRTEEDSGKIHGTLGCGRADKEEITISHYGSKKEWMPTHGRWKSFMWEVVSTEPAWKV